MEFKTINYDNVMMMAREREKNLDLQGRSKSIEKRLCVEDEVDGVIDFGYKGTSLRVTSVTMGKYLIKMDNYGVKIVAYRLDHPSFKLRSLKFDKLSGYVDKYKSALMTTGFCKKDDKYLYVAIGNDLVVSSDLPMICVAPMHFLSRWTPVLEKFVLGESVSDSNSVVNELSSWFCMFGEFMVLCKETHFDGVSELDVPIGVYDNVAAHSMPVLTCVDVTVVALPNVPGEVSVHCEDEEYQEGQITMSNINRNMTYITPGRLIGYAFNGNTTFSERFNLARTGYDGKVVSLSVRSVLSKIKVRRRTYYMTSSKQCFRYFHRRVLRIGCSCGQPGFAVPRCNDDCFVDSECEKCCIDNYLHQLSQVTDEFTLKQGLIKPVEYLDRRLYFDKRSKLRKLCEMFDKRLAKYGVRIVFLSVDMNFMDRRALFWILLETNEGHETYTSLSNVSIKKIEKIVITFFNSTKMTMIKVEHADEKRRNPDPDPEGFSGTG